MSHCLGIDLIIVQHNLTLTMVVTQELVLSDGIILSILPLTIHSLRLAHIIDWVLHCHMA